MHQLKTEAQTGSVDRNGSRHQVLKDRIDRAAHLLPSQGPITAFVHHNTLHAFEDQPFEEAVVNGGQLFGCHPFLLEEQYRKFLATGRIGLKDIDAVLIDDMGDDLDGLIGPLGTRFHLRKAMLEHPLLTGPTVELRWYVAESDALRRFRPEAAQKTRDRVVAQTRRWVMRDLRNAPGGGSQRDGLSSLWQNFNKESIENWSDDTWEAFTLHALWIICSHGVRCAELPPTARRLPVRHADLLRESTGETADRLVHELLIRFSAAFLDQGFADWPLRSRDLGFYQSFLSLYGQRGAPPDRWLRGLRKEIERITANQLTPLESIAESLELLGVEDGETEAFLEQTLLALRGFAGMIWQVETRGDRVAQPIPEGSLIELLAVRLILDRLALAWLAAEALGFRGPLGELRELLRAKLSRRHLVSDEQHAFQLFQLAQLIGWEPEALQQLPVDVWRLLLREIESFHGIERRRVYHLAYERQYRNQTLDAVAVHCRRTDHRGSFQEPFRRARFQISCCLDEREESFRRHLEEVAPECETFSVAGFYGIAMYYRGASDAHYKPLCPVIVQPRHYVGEEVVFTFEQMARRRRQRRRAIGTVTHQVHVGSRTFAGGWFAAVLGSVASIPLVMRIMFPRMTAQLRRLVGGFVGTPAVTQLQLERTEETPGPQEGHVGYRVDEMAAIVECILRDMGLTRNLSRLMIACGHGSSSLNNPHEAAHDCGACGGGRGGPNARAFAQMANDPRIRSILDQNGLSIPSDTVFVGAYHNTCDDSVTYYDLDRLPASHKADFEHASKAIDAARARSAHERCRRFESAALNLSADAALRHVEGRAEDLSQVRPEYGHATNALCFVGRRGWTRGLFLDRRAYLQSYDPDQDDENFTILARVLAAVIPVCAGIGLEYYFSFVDPTGYGCGTKLPHNIASLVGVMNGAASDLRPGLPWQMVEIHEPLRLLFVIEASPEAMLKVMSGNPAIDRLVRNRWVYIAMLDPATSQMQLFDDGAFRPYSPESEELPIVRSSADWYRGWRGHLGFASVEPTASAASPDRDSAQFRSESSLSTANHNGR